MFQQPPEDFDQQAFMRNMIDQIARSMQIPTTRFMGLVNTKHLLYVLRTLRRQGLKIKRERGRPIFIATRPGICVEVIVSDWVDIPKDGWWVKKPETDLSIRVEPDQI